MDKLYLNNVVIGLKKDALGSSKPVSVRNVHISIEISAR